MSRLGQHRLDIYAEKIAAGDPGVVAAASFSLYAMIRDEKATSTNGGTYTAGAFQTRDLQTKPVDEIGVTLAANQFTLPAGTYRIDANAPAEGVQNHCARLRNITDGVTTLDGSSELSLTASPNRSFIMGQFVIAAAKVFEIQHRGAITVANTGMGRPCAFGAVEVYTIVELLRVA
jgi:hypothetical protein